MDVRSIRTPSLGDATYILSHEGAAIIVDPQRDIDRFLDVVSADGLTVTHVLETHMHNDYVSGGRDLAASTGADLVLPAASGATFPFVPAFHQEELAGEHGMTVRPLHTPGHTLAHTSYLVMLDGAPVAVFTGGSLLVGSAGRSDLLGDDLARQLAVLQYGSLHRLAGLPDSTGVYPTHGEGSFCTASGAGRTTSTIGQEKAENPLYQFTTADDFADHQLAGLVPYPAYYRFMGPINRSGPRALAPPSVPDLSAAEAAASIERGAGVLDGRDRYAFAAGHVKGSLGIEVGDSFAPWAGWLFEFNSPLVLVLDPGQDAAAAATELGRIGFEQVVGVMRGVGDWAASGRGIASYRTADIHELTAVMEEGEPQVVDVRDPQEWAAGHLDRSIHRYVPDLAAAPPVGIDAAAPVWLVCRTGNRASIAAGLLERHGLAPVVVSKGGVPDVLARAVA